MVSDHRLIDGKADYSNIKAGNGRPRTIAPCAISA
jgi:hypothetical protein